MSRLFIIMSKDNPPPPPFSNFNSRNRSPRKSDSISKINISDSVCEWALVYPELRIACVRFRICLTQSPYKFTYKHVKSLLQVGPTCGLVSISMLLNHSISPTDLLSLAKYEEFSNNGELFDVSWTASLLEQAVRKINIPCLKFEVKKMKLYSTEVVDSLLNGCVLLVPYDCDKNHTPCLKKGHKAHWAVINGVILTEPVESVDSSSRDSVYVTSKHGKSLHVGLWKLYDLSESNNNLEEFSPEREYDNLEYVLPLGGLTAGLKGQFILVYPF